MTGRFVGVDMDVALPSITHPSHRTSVIVHLHVYRSISVPPLRFPLCTERNELGVALDRIKCRYVSVSLLKIFANHLIFLASCVYIIKVGYTFHLPEKRDLLFNWIVLVFTALVLMAKSEVHHLVSAVFFSIT